MGYGLGRDQIKLNYVSLWGGGGGGVKLSISLPHTCQTCYLISHCTHVILSSEPNRHMILEWYCCTVYAKSERYLQFKYFSLSWSPVPSMELGSKCRQSPYQWSPADTPPQQPCTKHVRGWAMWPFWIMVRWFLSDPSMSAVACAIRITHIPVWYYWCITKAYQAMKDDLTEIWCVLIYNHGPAAWSIKMDEMSLWI